MDPRLAFVRLERRAGTGAAVDTAHDCRYLFLLAAKGFARSTGYPVPDFLVSIISGTVFLHEILRALHARAAPGSSGPLCILARNWPSPHPPNRSASVRFGVSDGRRCHLRFRGLLQTGRCTGDSHDPHGEFCRATRIQASAPAMGLLFFSFAFHFGAGRNLSASRNQRLAEKLLD